MKRADYKKQVFVVFAGLLCILLLDTTVSANDSIEHRSTESVGGDFLHWKKLNAAEGPCHEVLNKYANAVSQFAMCSIIFSRPICMCEKCHHEYINVEESLIAIEKAKDSKGRSCSKTLMNKDRVEIVQSAYSFVTGLWSSAYCDNCFDSSGNVNELTRDFNQWFNETIHCIFITPPDAVNWEEDHFDNESCSKCLYAYQNLSQIYNNITHHYGDVCMDIVDMMNMTWHVWSHKLKCEIHTNPDSAFFVITPVIALLPILLYGISKLSSTQKERRLLRQRRLAEQLEPLSPQDS